MRRDLVAALAAAAGGVLLAAVTGAPTSAAAAEPAPMFREPLPLPDFAVAGTGRSSAAEPPGHGGAGQSWAEPIPDDALGALRGGRVHGVLIDIDGTARLADGGEGGPRLGGTLYLDDAGRLSVRDRGATAGLGGGADDGARVETFIGGLHGFQGIGQFVQVTGDNNVVEANLLITLNVFLTDGARLPGLSRLPFVNQVGR